MFLGDNIRRTAGATLAICMALLTVGCQTSGRTDSGGTGVSLSEPQEIKLSESDLNLPLLLPVRISSLTKQIRDNAHPNNRYELSGQGFATTHRISGAWYDETTRQEMLSVDEFSTYANALFSSSGGQGVVPNDVIVKSWKVGFSAIVQTNNGPCYFSRTALRLGDSAYDNDVGAKVDTIVTIGYCDQDVNEAMFATAAGSPSLVTDRSAYRQALIKAGK